MNDGQASAAIELEAQTPIFKGSYTPSASGQVDQLWPALFEMQNALDPIAKTEMNPHLKKQYADITAIWAAIRGPLKKAKVLVQQQPHPHPSGAMVTTSLIHVPSGQWVSGTLFVPSN